MSDERKGETDRTKAYRDLNRNVQREDILRKFKDQSRYIPPTKMRGMRKARKNMLVRRNNEKMNEKQSKYVDKSSKKLS